MLHNSASYAGLQNTPLNRPGYHNEIIARVYERDFIPEITNSDIDERVLHCNQEVQIMLAPEVGPWYAYNPNQQLVANQVTAEAICLRINNAAYNSIKIDKTTIHFACENWPAWEALFLDAVYERYVELQREWVLSSMILQVDPKNQGPHAGLYGNIDLGSRANPIEVNKDNVAFRFSQLHTVLSERLAWRQNEMFVVVPIALHGVLVQSNYANSGWVGGGCRNCSFGIDGMWEHQLVGFNVIESVHVPSVVERDGRICYWIIAGHRSAFAYVSDIIDGRLMEDIRTFGVEYQMLAVWDGKMIYPEAIAVGYWTFSNN